MEKTIPLDSKVNLEGSKPKFLSPLPYTKPFNKPPIPYDSGFNDIDNIRLFIPSNLDINLIKEGNFSKYLDKFLFFISTIHFVRVTNKNYKKDDYIHLHSAVLGKYIGKEWLKPIKKELERLGIIEINSRYKIGEHCMGYRLAEPYRNIRAVAYKVQKESFSCRIKNICGKLAKKNTKTPAHELLYNNLERISALPEAHKILEKICDSNECYNSVSSSLAAIEDKIWFFNFDKKTSRVFNNITNLKKELRPYLRLEGKAMVEIDIKNCQPLLLYQIYPNKTIKEAMNYKNLVETGNFYETLWQFCPSLTFQNRSEFKEAFLHFLFAKPLQNVVQYYRPKNLPQLQAVEETIKTLFPVLLYEINKIKTPNHNQLALMLQRLEGEAIIDGVVGEIAKMDKPYPVLTVHDSILTFPEYADCIVSLIENEFALRYSLKPSLKIKSEQVKF